LYIPLRRKLLSVPNFCILLSETDSYNRRFSPEVSSHEKDNETGRIRLPVYLTVSAPCYSPLPPQSLHNLQSTIRYPDCLNRVDQDDQKTSRREYSVKKLTSALFAFLVINLALTGVARADSVNLTGTIRDFLKNGTPGGHIDFENACCGDDHSIVTSALGLDGKPVYDGAGSWTTHGAGPFNQWYNDTLGVNVSAPLTITLDDSGHPGTYT